MIHLWDATDKNQPLGPICDSDKSLPSTYSTMMSSGWLQELALAAVALSYQNVLSIIGIIFWLSRWKYLTRFGKHSSCIADPDTDDEYIEAETVRSAKRTWIDCVEKQLRSIG